MGLSGILAMVTACSTAIGLVQSAAPDPSPYPVLAASGDSAMTSTLDELTPRLMALSGVVGVGEGLCDGQSCIKVFVAKKTEKLVKRIRDVAQSTPVDIVETGEFRARDRRDMR